MAKVSKDFTIYTDCWKEHTDIESNVERHSTVNHSIEFVNTINQTHKNTIERCWYLVNFQTPVRNRTRTGISLYLLRFMILRNESGDLIENLIN